ncbi:MAG: phosphate ABC transporter permease PstA [Dehalococcoidia bacterium]|nr:phosphate ABC transporter permease PstA [Dehalococcoidia bacterium]
MSVEETTFRRRLFARKATAAGFFLLCVAATGFAIAVLAVLLTDVTRSGISRLSWDFINSFPSRNPDQAGIKAALFGTLWMMGLTAAFAVPVGIGAAIYLEEYASRNWLNRVIQTNIANLAGVPSIVYGILGLAIFVRAMALGRSVLAGSLTMALLVLPIVIIASQEALRAVPGSIREAAYAVGASRWQVVSRQVLPVAMPGVLTGIILALSRAIGEAAPLIMIGALAFVPFVPSSPADHFTVLPIQIFNWASRPQTAFATNAAAAIIVLLVVLLSMNAVAIVLRNRFQSRTRG